MKLIQSHEVPSKLLDVILSAQKELVIVSPYVNLTYTKSVSNALVAARNRGVQIAFYIREDQNSAVSKEQVQSMGIMPRPIPNLHAKLYYNETAGILTSLNLLSSSIGNSIEIGAQLETPEELAELRRFVEQFIAPFDPESLPAISPSKPTSAAVPAPMSREEREFAEQEFGAILADYLASHVDRRCSIEGNPKHLSIRALGNTFSVNIEGYSSPKLIVQGILSSAEADRFPIKSAKHFRLQDFDYSVKRGGKGYYDQAQAVRKATLSAGTFNKLSYAEKKQLLPHIAEILTATRNFKDDYRN
ncbi:hypothetical protein HNQ93_002481 [Hymenobacter luteus]|uniref:Phospholipase D-like domain-containing protein n=2 Tax=Hymenobacter TaxID=89966 RepID=A0A7W9T1B7_9BACT|nr:MULTISPECIES: phospholipase D-like domain-containing protein [Hymenobacter]MBB4601950.1 hypothetical protein [Hymenobacter latericoloratus]MBB6059621.1 hypothetical protein [Hymenobacter luteus]